MIDESAMLDEASIVEAELYQISNMLLVVSRRFVIARLSRVGVDDVWLRIEAERNKARNSKGTGTSASRELVPDAKSELVVDTVCTNVVSDRTQAHDEPTP